MNTYALKKYLGAQSLILLSILFLMIDSAQANIGSINVINVTETSIQISWSWPSGEYQASGSGSPTDYKICYEVDGTLAFICGGSLSPQYSGTTTHTLTGLTPNTAYRIKVECHCKRKSGSTFRYGRWRNVSTITTSTLAEIPETAPDDTVASSLTVPEAYSQSLKVKLTHNDIFSFEKLRICYRRLWTPVGYDFETDCQESNAASAWPGITMNTGYLEFEPLSYLFDVENKSYEVMLHPDVDLKTCAKYKLYARGFNGLSLDPFIGRAETETNGPCHIFRMSEIIVNDFEDSVLVSYAKEVDLFYGRPLYDVVFQEFDQTLDEQYKVILKNDNEDITKTHTLLRYLIDTDSPVYEKWQTSRKIMNHDMSMEAYVAQRYPQLFQQLTNELRR